MTTRVPEITTARFLTGLQNGWHAVDPEGLQPGCGTHRWAVCGKVVRLALKFGAYDPGSTPVTYGPCHLCSWIVAARTGTLDAALARLADPVAHDAAADFLNAAGRDYREHDDPALMQLLAAVSDHAPVRLVSEECGDGDCEHEGDCPADSACRACSLQAGSWAGEWEGTYRSECTIPAPCAVLLALAEAARRAVAEAAAPPPDLKHERVAVYAYADNCDHPEPDEPDGDWSPADPAMKAYDDWVSDHPSGADGERVCLASLLLYGCRACTDEARDKEDLPKGEYVECRLGAAEAVSP